MRRDKCGGKKDAARAGKNTDNLKISSSASLFESIQVFCRVCTGPTGFFFYLDAIADLGLTRL